MSSNEKSKEQKTGENKETGEFEVKEEQNPDIKLTDDYYIRIGMNMQFI